MFIINGIMNHKWKYIQYHTPNFIVSDGCGFSVFTDMQNLGANFFCKPFAKPFLFIIIPNGSFSYVFVCKG